MKPGEIKNFYRQNLPHIQPLGATFFVTFRLKGSLPGAKRLQLRQKYEAAVARIRAEGLPFQKELIDKEREHFFAEYDQILDSEKSGPHYLSQPKIARLVKEELHRFDGILYELICYRYVRNEKEFRNIVAYILNNPVKAKLTDDWRKYPHSYLKGNEDVVEG